MKLLIKTGVEPPETLGNVTITVKVGETKTISASSLMSSIPPYSHIQDLPIGSITVVGHIGAYTELLTNSNTTSTLGYFTNNGNRIALMPNSTPTNAVLSNSTLSGGNFKVVGVKVGQSAITYKATAISGTQESVYSEVIGKITIKVIPNLPNQKPTNCNDSIVNLPISGGVIEASKFIEGYSDPEGDAPHQVRFDTVPTQGLSLVGGTPITVGMITTLQTLQEVGVTYIPEETQTAGSQVELKWSISDVGSQEFYTNNS